MAREEVRAFRLAFDSAPDPRFAFRSAAFRGTVDAVLAALDQSLVPMVLMGDPGVGKTTLCSALCEILETEGWRVACCTGDQGSESVSSIIESACEAIGINLPYVVGGNATARMQTLVRRAGGASGSLLLACDNAAALADPVIEGLIDLVKASAASDYRFALLLVGNTALADRIDPFVREAKLGAACSRIVMAPLPTAEIEAYVRYRLARAGASRLKLFAPEAIDRLAFYSKGVPGAINRLCTTALGLVEGEPFRRVGAFVIDRAAAHCTPVVTTAVAGAPSALRSRLRENAGASAHETGTSVAMGARALPQPPAESRLQPVVLGPHDHLLRPMEHSGAQPSTVGGLGEAPLPPLREIAGANASVVEKHRREAPRVSGSPWRWAIIGTALLAAVGVGFQAARHFKGDGGSLQRQASTQPAATGPATPPSVSQSAPQTAAAATTEGARSDHLPPAVQPVATTSETPTMATSATAPEGNDSGPTEAVMSAQPEERTPGERTPEERTFGIERKPGSPSMPAKDLEALTRRGQALYDDGDISAARLVLERAARGGSDRAAMLLARTYDPRFTPENGLSGVEPKPELAAYWYRRANELRARTAEGR